MEEGQFEGQGVVTGQRVGWVLGRGLGGWGGGGFGSGEVQFSRDAVSRVTLCILGFVRGVFKVSRIGNNPQNVQHVEGKGELLCSPHICQEVH